MVQVVDASKDLSRDPRNREVVLAAGGDPQIGNLETPVNSSPLAKWFISNLPAYRPSLSPFRRGLEVGMAHGYFIYGPFSALGPLRNGPNANLAGLLEAVGLVIILTGALSLYANSSPAKPLSNVTIKNLPVGAFSSKESWNNFASAFLVGGIGGAITAFLIYSNLELIKVLIGL